MKWQVEYCLLIDGRRNKPTDGQTNERTTDRTNEPTNERTKVRTNEERINFQHDFEKLQNGSQLFFGFAVLIAKRAEPIRKWRINIHCGGWTFMLSFLIYVEWLLPLSVQLIFPHDHGLLLSGNHTPHNDGLKTSAWCRRTDQSARDCCFRSPVVFRLAARVREMWTLLVY